ncbi:hypothetical protein F4553_000920 [Allocatelliglobosispora scoriae]|uniref:Uncharacterized protein n=1 Tax=Allocatelliglobosispora scoriae TaxID=643052 RepID=A0A841BL00_9ACTN|nr:hypothetical protein [Allocatelliglobosispora scoriae]MBB5867541.1 hypothetical protein [Allocatelliglobosispora scoriae]
MPLLKTGLRLRTKVIIGVVVILLAGCGYAGFTVAHCALGCPSEPSLGEVAAISQLRFPADSELLDSALSEWTDTVLYARIAFPRSELAAFQSTNDLPAAVAQERGVPASEVPGWWHPEKPATVSGIASACTPTACRSLMFDLDGTDTVVVWVHWFSGSQPAATSEPSPSA